ncbi:AraC family transcriptional regulator, partial [Vibrio parahaemolyticus]|nr:AraC family transcriptional regulator [Vibrio parahaemolyticus]
MKSSLSIRSYTKRMSRHTHSDYHQLVLPLQGNIHIDMDSYVGK